MLYTLFLLLCTHKKYKCIAHYINRLLSEPNVQFMDKGSFPTRVVPQAEAADYSRYPFPYAEGYFESRGLASSVSGGNH